MFLALSAAWGGAAACRQTAPKEARVAPRREVPAPETPPGRAHVVGTFARSTFGPRLAWTGKAATVVWALPNGPDAGLYAVHAPDATQGKLTLSPRQLIHRHMTGLSALELTSLPDGSVLALVSRQEEGQTLIEVYFGLEHAKPPGRSVEPLLVAAGQRVSWSQVLPLARGCLVFWAETAGGTARLLSRRVEAGIAHEPLLLATTTLAWQVGQIGEHPALLSAQASDRGARLEALLLDDRGHPLGPPRVLSDVPAFAGELDAAFDSTGASILYLEDGRGVPELHALDLDLQGKPLGPARPLTLPRGPQKNLSLQPQMGSSPPLVLWEEALQNNERQRVIQIGRLFRSKTLRPEAALDNARADRLLPRFTRSESFFFGVRRSGPGALPELWRFSNDNLSAGADVFPLAPDALEPLVAEHVWDIRCTDARCLYLGAQGGRDLTAFLASTDLGSPSSSDAPKDLAAGLLVRDDPALELPSLFELVTLPPTSTGTARVAGVTYFDPKVPYVIPKTPAKDGRLAPERAELFVLDWHAPPNEPDRSAYTPKKHTLSIRAHSPGGVSLAERPNGEQALAWTALDGGHPHIFITTLDVNGERKNQTLVQTGGRDISDVTLLGTPSGYIVFWSDARHGSSELYAMRVGENLQRLGTEVRLTFEGANPTDPSLHVEGERVLIAYSGGTVSPEVSGSRIFTLAIDLSSLGLVTTARALTDGSSHAFAPIWGDAARLFWLDSALGHGLFERTRLASVALDSSALSRRGVPSLLELESNILAFDTRCTSDPSRNCRLSFLTQDQEERTLWALALGASDSLQEASAFPLLRFPIDSAPLLRPLLLGDQVLYLRSAGPSDADAVLRAALVDWARLEP